MNLMSVITCNIIENLEKKIKKTEFAEQIIHFTNEEKKKLIDIIIKTLNILNIIDDYELSYEYIEGIIVYYYLTNIFEYDVDLNLYDLLELNNIDERKSVILIVETITISDENYALLIRRFSNNFMDYEI
jgi:hypothetical protein